MKITTVANVLKTEEIKSKDGQKLFHHANFVVDDCVVPCKFIKQEDYNLLISCGHLAQVECVFNVFQNGSDQNGNPLFSFRLASASAFSKTKSNPFSK